MYQGMDLSRFKKIASDGKVSTLRHSRGHEVKIAHSGLSPKMREHIDGMPVHLAEGGDPAAIDPESPAPAEDAPQPIAPPEVAPAPEPAPRVLPPKPAVMPTAGVIDVVGQRRPAPPPPPPTLAEQLDADALQDADEFARGTIHPKTMADLFAEKSTLGKIGTVFGLMIGGAGSGLLRHPNALLEIMQKELDRDLDAQKNSNANAQNWLRLSQEYDYQKAQREKLAADTALAEAMTGKIPAETGLLEAQAFSTAADADLKNTTQAMTRMQLGVLSTFSGMIDRMPEGAMKASAYDYLQKKLMPAVMDSIKSRNRQTEDKSNFRAAVSGKAQKAAPVDDGTGVDFAKLMRLERQGAAVAGAGMAGVGGMSPQQGASARQEAAAVTENRAIAKTFVDTYNRLDEAFLANKWNPALYDAEVASLGQQLAQRVGNSTSQAEYERILKSMFPAATDWGKTREAKFKHAVEMLKNLEAGTPTLDQFGLKTPFPTFKRTKKPAAKAGEVMASPGTPKEGAESTSKSGKPIIFKNGKWTYK